MEIYNNTWSANSPKDVPKMVNGGVYQLITDELVLLRILRTKQNYTIKYL